MHMMCETTFEFDGKLTLVGFERTFPVRILNCPNKLSWKSSMEAK
jgi:hypothetical protein